MAQRIVLVLLLSIFCSCDLPKDPNSSWENAKKEGLKIGVVQNPPFSYVEGGAFGGSEVQILNDFAEKVGLKVRYQTGNESDLLKKLEKYKVHVVIGGFDKKTIWKKKAGLTTEYNNENVFLVPMGENELLIHLENYLRHRK